MTPEQSGAFVQGIYRLVTPEKYFTVRINGVPCYHPCADCETDEAIIAAIHLDANGQLGVIEKNVRELPFGMKGYGSDYKCFAACFCEGCLQKRVQEAIATGEGVVCPEEAMRG